MPAEYVPTDGQRALVENAWAFGLTQADIAEQLGIDEKTLRKHFREELNSGKFKVDMGAGRTIVELMKSKDERVRLEAAKYYTSRRMGWKETNASTRMLERTAARSKLRT
jgi:predicted transcriptional regulator